MDHPRAGGEKKLASWSRKPCPGSPPRRRGKASFSGTFRPGVGITPAQAGKSRRLCPSGRRSKDHPRAGGEKAAYLRAVCGPRGSPPRRRGKEPGEKRPDSVQRITPAQAGKRSRRRVRRRLCQDHPRAGGEKKFSEQVTVGEMGSPPRRRGKVGGYGHVAQLEGITPAQAGKRCRCCAGRTASRDHPRAGGEKLLSEWGQGWPLGSPPRRRGKVLHPAPSSRRHRITPAQAGKSLVTPSIPRTRGDHPRAGGEKQRTNCAPCPGPGSPPRRRGKVMRTASRRPSPGITPAQAGKRLKRSHRSGIFISGPIPFHSVLHRPAGSGGSRAGRDGSPAGQPQNAGPA